MQTSIGYNNILCCTGRIISYTLLDLRSSTTIISEFEFSEIIHRDGTPRCQTARDASSVFDPSSLFSRIKKKREICNRRRVINLASSSGSRIHGRTACDSKHKPPQREFEFSLGQGQASVGPALNFEIAISTKSEKNEQTPKTRRNRGRQPDKNNRHTNQQFLARGPAAAATKDISALDK